MAAKTKTGFSGLDRSKTLAENTVNAGPVVLDSNVVFDTTAPYGSFRNEPFHVTIANATGDDHFSIAEVGGITVTNYGVEDIYYNGVLIGKAWSSEGANQILIELNNNATGEALTALSRAVSYSYSGDAPPTTARTVTFTIADSTGTSSSATMQLKLKAENDAPIFSGFGPHASHNAIEATAGVMIDTDAHVTNPDGTGFKGGKLTVHLAAATATDRLYLSDGAFSVTGKKLFLDGKQVGTVSADGASGHDLSFTFNASAAISDAQMSALMEQVTYRSSASSVPTGTRDVTFSVTDAEKSTASAHASLTFDAQAATLDHVDGGSASPVAMAAFAAANAPGTQLIDTSFWSAIAASLSGTSENLFHLFASLESPDLTVTERAYLAPSGTVDHVDLHLEPFHLGALERAATQTSASAVDFLEALGAHAQIQGATAQMTAPHNLVDGAEALAARLWSLLHVGNDGGHSFI